MYIEALVDSLTAAKAAERSGADQLELNSALEFGGLTPTAGVTALVCEQVKIPVYAMIRPRKAGFVYSVDELLSMQKEIEILGNSGVSGFVFGCLSADLTIDKQANRALLQACAGLPAVFHRAFDLVPDYEAGAETLIALGFKRILTKGSGNDIEASLTLLQNLQAKFSAAIAFNFSGIRPHNCERVCSALKPEYLHVQARKTVRDTSLSGGGIYFGARADSSETEYLGFDTEYFQALVKQLRICERKF